MLPPQEPAPGSGRKVWLGVLIGFIVVAVLAGAGYLLAQGLLGNNDDTTTPFPVANVIGFTQERATQELEDAGLKVEPKFKVIDSVKPGRVIDQDPVPGTIVDPDSTVIITIAKAPPPVVVPTFTGLTLGDAQTLATENHLVLVPTEGQSDTVPVGSRHQPGSASGRRGPAGDRDPDRRVGAARYGGRDRCHLPLVRLGEVRAPSAGLGRRPRWDRTGPPAVPEPEPGRDPGSGRRHRGGCREHGDAVHRRDHVADRTDRSIGAVGMTIRYAAETFTPDERAILERHFTNLDGPVFALTNLPEVVKGALFARYSRTKKSLRRLFLDEFAEDVGATGELTRAGEARAEQLYERVFVEYGDDSVAQLGGVHLACEQASQLLCKALEWGRLAAYLEQSTRYMRYDDRPGDAWRATVPPEIAGTALEPRFRAYLDTVFEAYGRMYEPMEAFYQERFPKDDADSDFVYRSTIMAKTCDTLRMLLPAATRSNLGIYATGQSYEQLLMRLAAHPLAEMREYGELMLVELRKVIPAFLKRVDVDERGVAWTAYWRETRAGVQDVTAKVLAAVEPEPRPEVTLTDWDPDGEVKVVAAALYAESDIPDDQLLAIARDADARTAGRRAGGDGGRPRQPPAQAGPRVGAHRLPVRRVLRLRGVPGPPAAPSADDRVAAPHHRARLRRARPRSTTPGCVRTGTGSWTRARTWSASSSTRVWKTPRSTPWPWRTGSASSCR